MSLRKQRLLLLAFCLLLTLNYPWLAIFSADTLLFGVPLLHLYLFVQWLLIILTVRFLLAGESKETNSSSSKQYGNRDADDAAK